MRLKKKGIGWGLVIFLVLAQFIPVDRSNPPAAGEVNLPDDVRQIVKTSCYDCHSNETRWPWYGYVAPVSWVLAYHVHEGKEHLNLSSWEKLSPEKQKKMAHEMWEEVEEGEMPVGVYLLMHSEAKLSGAHMQVLKEWSESYGVVPESVEDTAAAGEDTTNAG